jgi:hypothetical protein
VIWLPDVKLEALTHPLVMAVLVQAVAVYDAGAVPLDGLKVTASALAVVVEGVAVTAVGAFNWLVALCGPATVEVAAK